MNDSKWFGVRTVYEHLNRRRGRERLYEERVVLVRAETEQEAFAKAEAEAREYAGEDTSYLGYALSFELVDPPGDGIEVFSLMRDSRMEPKRYLDRFFDTGRERAREHESQTSEPELP